VLAIGHELRVSSLGGVKELIDDGRLKAAGGAGRAVAFPYGKVRGWRYERGAWELISKSRSIF